MISLIKPKAVKFSDKVLLFYCKIRYLGLRLFLRVIIGKRRRDRLWNGKEKKTWMSPINGRRILIENEQGFRFWIRANTEDAEIVSTEFENDVLDVLKPVNGDICIDIGANVGKYVIHMASLVGSKGKVIAIEPFDDTFNILCENIKENDFENIVTPIKIALSNKKGKSKMYFLKNLWGQNSIVGEPTENFVYVNTDTLDSILEDLKIEKIDWIKIDVEGAEWEVLSGSINLLRNNEVKLIIEVRSKNMEKVKKLIESLGYTCHILESYNEGNEKLAFYNLFAKKSM